MSYEELEQFFQCPYCLEEISILLDLSVDDSQSYIEDCEVCCRPIQISYTAEDGQLVHFDSLATQK